jgi:hypothetical protein
MHIDEECVVYAIELDGLADWRIDNLRLAQDFGGMTADPIEAIERPDGTLLRGRRRDAD